MLVKGIIPNVEKLLSKIQMANVTPAETLYPIRQAILVSRTLMMLRNRQPKKGVHIP